MPARYSKPVTVEELDHRAREILLRNDRGTYTVPNGRVYPFQWNWDSAFASLGFAAFDLDRAWREIESLFEGQWEDGFLPHIIFWKDDAGYFAGPGSGPHRASLGIRQGQLPGVGCAVAGRRRLARGPVRAARYEPSRPERTPDKARLRPLRGAGAIRARARLEPPAHRAGESVS